MRMQVHSLAGVLALAIATAAAAQNTAPPTQQPTTVPDEPGTPPSTAPGQPTSPGQSPTTPGQASTGTPPATGQTPSGNPVPDQAQASELAKATAADVKAGMSVYDAKGGLVGKVVSSTAKGVVVDTGSVRASVPLSSLAKGDKGLVVGMTKAELEAAAKKSSPKPKQASASHLAVAPHEALGEGRPQARLDASKAQPPRRDGIAGTDRIGFAGRPVESVGGSVAWMVDALRPSACVERKVGPDCGPKAPVLLRAETNLARRI